jgi:hypothetical protein
LRYPAESAESCDAEDLDWQRFDLVVINSTWDSGMNENDSAGSSEPPE